MREDPHLWATTLFDELAGLGFEQSYQTLTRQVRERGLRPACETCHAAKRRPVAVIEHPPGEEAQWDWVELPGPPEGWGWGSKACLFVGALAHSGKVAGAVGRVDGPTACDRRARSGVTRTGRVDRRVAVRSHGDGVPSRHRAGHRVVRGGREALRGVGRDLPGPARHGNRKGVVEKANHTAAQRSWRTLGRWVLVSLPAD